MPDITKTLADALRTLSNRLTRMDINDAETIQARAALRLYDAATVTQGAGTEEVERVRLIDHARRVAVLACDAAMLDTGAEPSASLAARTRDELFAVIEDLAARAAPASTNHEEVRRRLSFIGRVLETTAEQQAPQDRADAHWMVRELQRMLLAPSSPSAEPQAGGAK